MILTDPNDVDAVDAPLRYVSCAPFRLYGTNPPAELTGLYAQDFGITVLDELFAGCRYDSPFPADGFVAADLFTEHLANFYAEMSVKRCPPSLLVRIEGATLFKTVIRCAGEGGAALLYETHRAGDRVGVTMPTTDQLAATQRRRFSGRRWQNLVVGSIGSPNYGHWLVDDLPRLKAAMHLMAADPRPVRILLHEFHLPIDRVRADTIRRLFGDGVSIEWLDFNRAYRFDELCYATPVSDHPVRKSPLALAFAARRLIELAFTEASHGGRGDRLFVVRGAARGRALTNHAAVRELVIERGFRIVDPEAMDALEQVQLFANAHSVIGQMGAAMTNTLFCPPTTTTLYLAPSGWIEPFYWDLAAVCGHRYRVLYGAVEDPAVPPHESAFTIPIDILSAAIDAL